MTKPDDHTPVPAPPATLFTTPEIARSFRVSTRTVDRWIASGTIRSVKVGGRRLVPVSEVRRLTEAQDSGHVGP